VTIVDALTAVNEDDWQIAADIKDGKSANSCSSPSTISPTAFACFSRAGSLSGGGGSAADLFIVSLHRYFTFRRTWPRWDGSWYRYS